MLAFCLLGAAAFASAIPAAAADPVRDAQWHLAYLQVPNAHTYSQGEGVVVGVVDTGVDAGHPDLTNSVLAGRDFSGEGDGRTDTNGHGTAMVGLIAAHGRSLGLAPKAKVLPVRKGIGSVDAGPSDEAINWAIDNGARILCLAFVQSDSPPVRQAIQKAIASDIVVIAGVGNVPYPARQAFPAGYPGVIGVAGVDRNGNHAAISVVSPFATLAAPAVDITSTDIRGSGHTGYQTASGTSDATAIVAGAAALVRAKFPQLSAAEVVHRLTATADDKGAPGRDDEYGYGVVNLVRALTADVPPLQPSATPTATSSPGQATTIPDVGGISARTVVILGALVITAVLSAAFVTIALRQRAR